MKIRNYLKHIFFTLITAEFNVVIIIIPVCIWPSHILTIRVADLKTYRLTHVKGDLDNLHGGICHGGAGHGTARYTL